MDYGYGNGSIGALFSLIFGIYFAVLCFAFVVAIVAYVLNGLALMALFRKVGIEPWAAWVPILNIWRLLELGGQPGWFSLIALIPYGSIVTVVFECIAVYRIGIAFRKSGSWVVLFVFLPFVWAWLLAAQSEVYDPDLIRQAGYGPPLVGFGSARGPYQPPAGPYVPPTDPAGPAGPAGPTII